MKWKVYKRALIVACPWLLLAAAVAAFCIGLGNGWTYLVGAGVALFAAFCVLNGRTDGSYTVHTEAAEGINPATGLPLVIGTHIDVQGNHYGAARD